MSPRLKHVDPNRPPGLFSRAYAALANTRLGRFMSANVVWKVDPYLMRVTRGRVGMGLVMPTALLETRGARSGAVRRNVVIYIHDGNRVTIVASPDMQNEFSAIRPRTHTRSPATNLPRSPASENRRRTR